MTQTTQFAYDAAGRQTQVTNATGITSTATYDRAGRVTATTDGLGRRTRYAYDAAGRLVRSTDPAGTVTAYEYDPLGRLAAVVENYRPPYASDHQTNVRTEYGYDANGNLLTVKDARGIVTRYAYDARNQPIRVTDPLSNTRQMSYTPRGELASTIDALNRTTSYEYNPVGALTRIQRPDESIRFQYDALMRHTAMTDTLGVTRFSYDPLGRVTAVLDPFNQQVGYGYDAAGNRTSLAYPGNKNASYAYDGLNRLIQVTDWENQVTSYSYDAANRLATALLPNGVTSSYAYDTANQLTSIEHRQASTLLARFAYSYDDGGNRLTAAEILAGAATSISYGYDPLARLISATATGGDSYTESYSYDAAGNRVQQIVNGATTNYTYDAANRLTQAGAASYTWDANGNLLGDGSRSYTYDSADRLKILTQGSNSYSFAYNGLGNRLQQTVGGVATNYLLDLNADLPQVLDDGTATYLYGNWRLGMQQASGWSYYQSDALGSVRLVTNGTGQISGQASYTPFGAELAGSSLVSAFGFTGEQLDPTGLVYLRARYYDPAQGRFLRRDPFAGWRAEPYSLHPYQYAYSNPVRYSDPSGRWVESALDIAFIAYDVYDIAKNGLNWQNGLSLAADVGGLILPGITGGGVAVRALTRADDATDVARAAVRTGRIRKPIRRAAQGFEVVRQKIPGWFGARGPHSGREFDLAAAGGPIRQLSTCGVRITERGIRVVEKHLPPLARMPPIKPWLPD